MNVEVLSALGKAERKLAGARYDLTREDKHPNDTHKAQRKIEEAVSVLELAIADAFTPPDPFSRKV